MALEGGINNSSTKITTYGALILPFDPEESKVQVDAKEYNKTKGKFLSALHNAPSAIKETIKNPSQTMSKLATYIKDKRTEFNGDMSSILNKGGQVYNTLASKFSGIAVAQAIMDGNISNKEAIDYLFMGFAPALGVTGSLMGYSGLNQMKDALSNGHVNVGSFVSGFARTLKGATDLKDYLKNKVTSTEGNIVEFDLTISHGESYQSETPDRRVQNGQSLNEFIHNLPETFEVQCALQEGKRYSKAEFRAIIKLLRDRKDTVSLILGDETFDNLILTDFSPNSDCTKSGFDYTLSFKKLNWGAIKTDVEVNIQKLPTVSEDDTVLSSSGGIGGSGGLPSINAAKGGAGGVGSYDVFGKGFSDAVQGETASMNSMLKNLKDSGGKLFGL